MTENARENVLPFPLEHVECIQKFHPKMSGSCYCIRKLFFSFREAWYENDEMRERKKICFERNSFVSYFSELRRGSHDSKINYLVMKTRPFMVKYWHDKTLETREKVTLEQHDFQHFSCFGTFPFRS